MDHGMNELTSTGPITRIARMYLFCHFMKKILLTPLFTSEENEAKKGLSNLTKITLLLINRSRLNNVPSSYKAFTPFAAPSNK